MTEVFNTWVRDVARRLQEPMAADDGYLTGTHQRYSAVLVAGYVNGAIRDVVRLKLLEYGDQFPDKMPEVLKASGPLTVTNGALLRPVDCLVVLGVTSGSLFYRRLPGRSIAAALSGLDPALTGSATEPVFYEEGRYLYTLGKTDGDVVLHYIIKHQDIVISTAASGNGKWYTGANGAYTLATKKITGTFSTVLAAGDVGKNIMFRSATKVHHARISSFIDATNVTVAGSDLPAGNIAAGSVIQMLVSDISPETTDLQLSEHWKTEVEELAVQKGILDARRGLLNG